MENIIISIIIVIATIAAFATQVIPAPVTAVLSALCMMLFGIITPSETISSFGSDTVMMVIGVMIIGNAVLETGLADKIGSTILRSKHIVSSEKKFLAAVLSLVALLSAFMSNTATIAIFIPVIASVVKASKGKIKQKNILMAAGIASILGGNCTLAGSTPQMTAQGILENTAGAPVMTFLQVSYVAVPLVLLTILYYVTIGYKLQQKCFDFEDLIDHEALSEQEQETGSKRKQMVAAAILLGCVAGFVSGCFSLGTIALLCGCLCIVTKCISCKRAFELMDWSTIAILGGSLGFSKGLTQSGAMDFLADKLLVLMGGAGAKPVVICTVLIVMASIMGNLMSHTATVAVLTPLGISMANTVAVSPIAFVIGIIIGSNLAFATPIATPPLTMTLVGGYRFTDYTKVGGLLNIILLVFTIILVPLIYLG